MKTVAEGSYSQYCPPEGLELTLDLWKLRQEY
jgi:hypothetical protein